MYFLFFSFSIIYVGTLYTQGGGTVLTMLIRLGQKPRFGVCFFHVLADGEFHTKGVVF